MTKQETRACIALLGTLWTSYKPPQGEAEMTVLVNTWQQFFASVSESTVSRAIMRIAAEGGEFAPQVGQIYARIKEAKAVPRGGAADYRRQCCVYARVVGVALPAPGEDCKAWFYRTRDEVRNG